MLEMYIDSEHQVINCSFIYEQLQLEKMMDAMQYI